MKKWSIFGFVAALVVASAIGCRSSRQASDAALAREVVGTWTKDTFNVNTFSVTNPVIFKHTISPDGTFSYVHGRKSVPVTFQGTWQVKDGEFIATFTNSFGTRNYGAAPVAGKVSHYRILHLDEHQFSYEVDGITNSLTRR